MDFSVFAPFGMLEFVDDISDAEKIYNAIVSSFTDPKTHLPFVDLTVGGSQEAEIYATAMELGAARATIRRAKNQYNGNTAYEMLSALEWRYQIAPGKNDSVEMRGANVAAFQALAKGSRQEAIDNALRTLLGSRLINVRILTWNDGFDVAPANPAVGPGIFPRPDTVPRLFRLLEPVTILGSPSTVLYTPLDPNEPNIALVAGDVVTAQPELWVSSEKVTISSVAAIAQGNTVTATFTKAHDIGAILTAGPCPLWISEKRHFIVIVDAATSVDPEWRRKINGIMEAAVRSTSTWDIVQPTSPGATTIGPFTVGVSPLGAVPVQQQNVMSS